jgi:hypothetical protein
MRLAIPAKKEIWMKIVPLQVVLVAALLVMGCGGDAGPGVDANASQPTASAASEATTKTPGIAPAKKRGVKGVRPMSPTGPISQ